MSDRDDGGPVCCRCDAQAVRKQGRQWLCAKHYRFGSMRVRAKRDGKVVPSWEQLENILSYINNMKCPHCARIMNWLRSDGAATQVTLQHYRSGSLGLICLSCNTRHAQMAGDSFCNLAADHKVCPGCNKCKPLEAFRRDFSRRWDNRASYCRECANERRNRWVAKNREHVNAKQREGRRRRGDVAS